MARGRWSFGMLFCFTWRLATASDAVSDGPSSASCESPLDLVSFLMRQGAVAKADASRQVQRGNMSSWIGEAFDSNLTAAWDQGQDQLRKMPICKLFPARCSSTRPMGYKISLLASARMYASVGFIGGALLAMLVLALFIVGFCLNHGSASRWRAVNGDQKSPEDVAKPEASASAHALGPWSQFFWPLDGWCRWWWMPPNLSEPLGSMKLYVCMLLILELLALPLAGSCTLAAPELLALERSYPARRPLTPPLAEWLMPNFEANVHGWAAFFVVLRRILLVSWCIFLVLPKAGYQRSVAASYMGGALVYVYFALVGIMYSGHHSCQGTIWFVFSAMFAVPFLETNPLAGPWLRRFALLDVLVPYYFFAGVTKLRYEGLWSNISGHWLLGEFKAVLPAGIASWMSSAPAILGSTPWPFTLMSWGNLIVELVLPLLAMLSANEGPTQAAVRLIFCLAAISFHVTVYLVMGPNFLLQIPLLIFANNPLYLLTASERSEKPREVAPSLGDRFRGVYAMVILILWYRAELMSDVAHLTGETAATSKHDSSFPFPEFSMFIMPGANSNFHLSCGILVVAFVILLMKMLRDVYQASPA
ncbi:unnamed protein product [Effrenium voratum]|uniref:Uncharacterized protein n=1 Tax=Effrenium voratum TaxID=2562239 RepID=A0AA36N681_9DINO|nr:unnamed protein product [Effrenium voratum]